MRRLLLIYNPNSSQYVHVKSEVLMRTTKVRGYMVGKFEIKKAPFHENVRELGKVLQDGDICVAVGGDATAAVTANAIMESGLDVTLAVLPYGNFNDLARTLGMMKYEDVFPLGDKKVKKLYPLDIIVDGKHWRYATCYVTMGMTAESVELFDEPKFRKKMQKGHKSSWRSYVALAKWYFKNRKKKVFMPEFTLNGEKMEKGISDYCALSGRSMCRVMKGGDDYLKPEVFRSEKCRLTSFPRLLKLMVQSMLVRTPGTETRGDVIEFVCPATVELQAEGEYQVFREVRRIEVKKSGEYIKVIHK
ncbi:hypothetical protein IJJ37_00100 [Candidatus Saccharibacteria bacterium]|nr:hypothetical protein [Candidatus Saccharibacteria bacterium]